MPLRHKFGTMNFSSSLETLFIQSPLDFIATIGGDEVSTKMNDTFFYVSAMFLSCREISQNSKGVPISLKM